MYEFIFLLAVTFLPWQQAALAAPLGCELGYRVIGASAEEDELISKLKGNLYKVTKRSPGETAAANARAIRDIDSLPLPPLSARKGTLNPGERDEFFREIMALPEVQNSLCGRYKNSGKFGFCFGRAFAVHIKALKSGINKRSIRKIWAVGDLRMNGNKWNYHVATSVRGDDGKWWVLDPIFGKPLTAEDWYIRIRRDSDPDKTMRVYSTEAGRLFPYRADNYRSNELKRELFRDFFTDVLSTIRQEQSR